MDNPSCQYTGTDTSRFFAQIVTRSVRPHAIRFRTFICKKTAYALPEGKSRTKQGNIRHNGENAFPKPRRICYNSRKGKVISCG